MGVILYQNKCRDKVTNRKQIAIIVNFCRAKAQFKLSLPYYSYSPAATNSVKTFKAKANFFRTQKGAAYTQDFKVLHHRKF